MIATAGNQYKGLFGETQFPDQVDLRGAFDVFSFLCPNLWKFRWIRKSSVSPNGPDSRSVGNLR